MDNTIIMTKLYYVLVQTKLTSRKYLYHHGVIMVRENCMAAGQVSLPFSIAGVTMFLSALVLHFASPFHFFARFLANVSFMICIQFYVAIHGTSMPTIETGVARSSATSSSWILPAIDNSPMATSAGKSHSFRT